MQQIITILLLLGAVFLTGCHTAGTTADDHPVEVSLLDAMADLPSDPDAGAERIIQSLSLRQKIGQMFVVAGRGGFYTEDEPVWQRMNEAVTVHQVGGIMFFSGNIYDQVIITNRLQQTSRLPLWVSQDMEFGAAMRIPEATYFTPAMGIAATGNPEYAYQKGRITGLEAAALGIHQIYAPVLDVNNNPLNPVINVRSFSENPDTVARYGIAFMKGAQDAGVMSTAKHFPGHGDTDVDSHLDLPTLPFDYYRLSTLELIPFSKAIEAGLRSVMTAHIAIPEIALNAANPGTLDPYITRALLRDSLDFDGLIVTDGMGMRGIRNFFDAGEAAVMAVKAGIDQILLPADLVEAMDAVQLAVLSGDISEERIDESVRRILKEKISAGLFSGSGVIDLEQLHHRIHIREHRLVADRIAQESVTLLKNEGDILPLDNHAFEHVVMVHLSDGRRRIQDHISRLLEDPFDSLTVVEMFPGQCDEDRKAAMSAVDTADLVVAISHVAIRTAEGISLDETISPIAEKLFAGDRAGIAVSLGTPYVITNMAHADAHVLGWSPHRRQQIAVARALLGLAPVNGRLQVSIPSMYSIGDGLTLNP